jgi:hypothetical protein
MLHVNSRDLKILMLIGEKGKIIIINHYHYNLLVKKYLCTRHIISYK